TGVGGQCNWTRSRVSVPRLARDRSVHSRKLASVYCAGSCGTRRPILVATVIGRPGLAARNCPIRRSLRPSPYTSAVSRNVTPACGCDTLAVAREGAAGSAGRTESASVHRLYFAAVRTTVFRRAGTRAPDSVRRRVMSQLPDRPDTDQLRRQARELHRAAVGGDTSALGRLRQVSDKVTLSAAQLALARDYGFPNWSRLQAA